MSKESVYSNIFAPLSYLVTCPTALVGAVVGMATFIIFGLLALISEGIGSLLGHLPLCGAYLKKLMGNLYKGAEHVAMFGLEGADYSLKLPGKTSFNITWLGLPEQKRKNIVVQHEQDMLYVDVISSQEERQRIRENYEQKMLGTILSNNERKLIIQQLQAKPQQLQSWQV